MNVTSLTSSSGADQLWQLLENAQSAQTTSTSSSSSTSSTTASSSTDSSSLSSPAQLFKELQDLASSNPTEFKKITAQIASQLQTAASNSTDPGQANFLNQMAANFSKASSSGKFSDLFPSQSGSSSSSGSSSTQAAPPAHHHHHYSSSDSSSDSSSSSSSDPLSTIFSSALSQIKTDLSS